MITYAPINITGNTVTTNISGYPDTQSIVIYNESQFFINVQLIGQGNYTLAAYTADAFPVFSGFNGGVMIAPSQYLNIGSNTQPASVVFIQSYGSNDLLTQQIKNNASTGYPISLNRLQNIGNGVNLVSGTATQVQNDGNAIDTLVVEATVEGDTQSAVSIKNDGNVAFGNTSHPGSFLTMGTSTLADILQIINSVTCILNQLEGADFEFTSPTGNQIGRIANNGNITAGNSSGSGTFIGSKLQLPVGSISKLSIFSGSANSTGTVVNHGLGVIPDMIIIQFTSNHSDTCVFAYDPSSLTSTTVTVYTENATARTFTALAIKQ